jgi:hypothetical protein
VRWDQGQLSSWFLNEQTTMLELLIQNITYVSYRLLVTAHVVKFVNRYVTYYVAVIIAAQLSYYYDNLILGWWWHHETLPDLYAFLVGEFWYTLRVIAAWAVIKKLWDWLGHYYWAVFIGAELTFIVDKVIIGWVWG